MVLLLLYQKRKCVYIGIKSTKNGMHKQKSLIPGFSFSWKRALGITKVRQNISRATGVPMSKAGMERKIGNPIIKFFTKGIR